MEFLASHGSPTGALILLAGLAVVFGIVKLAFGLREFWRERMIRSRPAQEVGKVDLGAAEVQGHAAASRELASPILQRPCVYWHYKVEMLTYSGRQDSWVTTDERRSADSFFVEDKTGRIRVQPRGAELEIPTRFAMDTGASGVIPHTVLAFARSRGILGQGTVFPRRVRFTEWTIRPGDPLFVFGTVSAIRDHSTPPLEERVIGLGPVLKLLYIAEKSRQQVVTDFGSRAWTSTILGGLLALGGLAGMALFFGWI